MVPLSHSHLPQARRTASTLPGHDLIQRFTPALLAKFPYPLARKAESAIALVAVVAEEPSEAGLVVVDFLTRPPCSRICLLRVSGFELLPPHSFSSAIWGRPLSAEFPPVGPAQSSEEPYSATSAAASACRWPNSLSSISRPIGWSPTLLNCSTTWPALSSSSTCSVINHCNSIWVA